MFKGSIVALVTPMQEGGAIDYSALDDLLEWHEKNSTDGLVIVGTTGESATLDVDEHRAVIRRVIKKMSGRLPIIAGTGANATSEALTLTQYAKEDGADACLLVAPYYNKPTQEGLYQHYKLIAESVDVPQILYNVPGRTVTDILPETVARLSSIPNIIGIKDATGNLERLKQMQDLIQRPDFIYLTGDDATALEFMRLGGAGGISVTGNVAPRANHDLYRLALEGDFDAAKRVDDSLRGLHTHLFCESNPIPVKWALQQMGLCSGAMRLPLTPLSTAYHECVLGAMNQAGVL